MINEIQAHKYCSEPLEKIENYAEAIADSTQTWDIHHRLEVNNFNHSRNDRGIVSHKQLIEDGMYWNRPASELIFVTRSQHKKIHKALCAKAAKIGAKMGGRIGGKKMKGKLYWNNGVVNKRSTECPGPGFVRGQLKKKSKEENET